MVSKKRACERKSVGGDSEEWSFLEHEVAWSVSDGLVNKFVAIYNGVISQKADPSYLIVRGPCGAMYSYNKTK